MERALPPPPRRPPDSRGNTLCTCRHICLKAHPGGQWIKVPTASNHRRQETLGAHTAYRRGRGGTALGGARAPADAGRERGNTRAENSSRGRGRGGLVARVPSKRTRSLSESSSSSLSRLAESRIRHDSPPRSLSPIEPLALDQDLSPETAAASEAEQEAAQPAIDHVAQNATTQPAPNINDAPQERFLGLYDDPDDLDALQLLFDDALDLSENPEGPEPSEDRSDDPSADPPDFRVDPRADPPDEPPGDPPDTAPESAASRPAPPQPVPAPSTGEIPGLSAQKNPLFVQACNLPEIPAPRPPEDVYSEAHELWYIRAILLLVTFLHTHHHVTFRACDLTLFTLRSIFVTLKLIENEDSMPSTLSTALKRLDLVDRFHILIECSKCRRLMKPGIVNYSAKCPACDNPLFVRGTQSLLQRLMGKTRTPIPKAVTPLRLLSRALVYLIKQPGMEVYMDAWRHREIPPPGEYRSIQDGKVWKTLPGPDGCPFFGPDYGQELRVAVILHADGFQASTSAFSASYSTSAISFSIPNLPPEIRYRAQNLLLCALTDGPKEPDAEEIQYWLEVVVDDLLMLYYLGILVPTESQRNGRRSRAVLVCTCADHPAMCKVGGFADKAHHNTPCTQGTINAAEMYSDVCLNGGCPLRSFQDHLKIAAEWRDLGSTSAREVHFKTHGIRWSELLRLPYYDCVRMTVIDPMHNLLLGVVKNQWYACWIQNDALRADTKAGTVRELSVLHQFLETFEAPQWVGRLPMRVGEPAGGSLTADEYKLLMTCPAVLILPLIWIKGVPEATRTHKRALVKYEQAMVKYEPIKMKHDDDVVALEAAVNAAEDDQKRKRLEKKLKSLKAKPPPAPPRPRPRMRSEEIPLMLGLSAALKLLLGSSTTRAQRERGAQLLYEYLASYKALEGVDAMMPNHHYATHIPEQLELFATVYEMWAFLGERLNMVLRSTNLNGRRGGQQEVTMMREFDRDQALRNMAQSVAQTPSDMSAAGDAAVSIAQRMLHNRHEARGTLEMSAQGNGLRSNVQDDACSSEQIGLGTTSKYPVQLSLPNREEILKFYRKRTSQPPIYHAHDPAAPHRCVYLTPAVHTLSYAVLNGRRITPLSSSAIVKVSLEGHGYLVADVVKLFLHKQSGQDIPQVFAEVRWMIPQDINRVFDNPWAAYPELEVRCWRYRDHMTPAAAAAAGLPDLIPLRQIRYQLGRGVCELTEPKFWLTITLEGNAISMEALAEVLAGVAGSADAST